MHTSLLKKSARGFTLIETVVYLGLFAIIMGGAVVTSYDVFESSGRNQTRALLEVEGGFLVAKIGWAVSGAQAVNLPAVGTIGSLLSVTKWDVSIGTVTVGLSGNDMIIARSGNPSQVLNNTNVVVENLLFTHAYGGGVNPESVQVSFRIRARDPRGAMLSQDFSNVLYLRR